MRSFYLHNKTLNVVANTSPMERTIEWRNIANKDKVFNPHIQGTTINWIY